MWLKITQSCFVRLGEMGWVISNAAGSCSSNCHCLMLFSGLCPCPSQYKTVSPAVRIAEHSAWCPRPNRTRTEACETLASPGRLSIIQRIGHKSLVFSQHQDSALRTDDEQGEPFWALSDCRTSDLSQICRTSDLRRHPGSLRGQLPLQIGTRWTT